MSVVLSSVPQASQAGSSEETMHEFAVELCSVIDAIAAEFHHWDNAVSGIGQWFKEAFASISSQSSHYNGGVFVAVSQDYKSKDKTKSDCIRRPIQKCLACIACGCTTNGGLEDQIGTTVGQASKTSDSRAHCVLGEILASTHQ